jgi:hypothetical protein
MAIRPMLAAGVLPAGALAEAEHHDVALLLAPSRSPRCACRAAPRSSSSRRRAARACTARGIGLLVPDGDARPALERFYRRAARVEIAPRLDRAT